MENVDSTVIATSLATIAHDLDTEPVALKLALTSYLVALSIFIPASNWVADRFGARRVFRLAMLVFVAGSICCAISNSLESFVLSRFLQGMGGGMMTPIARLIIVRSTARNDLVQAMAWLSIPALVGPILGPPIGGLITTYFSWHWIFLVNVPIGIAGVAIAGRLLPEWPPQDLAPFDYMGLLLAGTGFAGCLFGLSVLTLPALPPAVGFIALAAGIVCLILYVARFRSVSDPLLNLRVFRFPLFRRTVIGGFFFRIGAGAMPFLFPLMLQLTFGLNPLQSGLVTFATAIGAFSAKFTAGIVISTLGFRSTILWATSLSAAGLFSVSFFTPETPSWLMMTLLMAIGFCQSTFWTATNAFTFADVSDSDAGQANILSQVSVQLSLATGVAVGGAILEWVRLSHGGGVELGDFTVAFGAIACFSFLGTLVFWGIPKDAGDDMARRRLP
jgi:EmrB/QacA subfamily drug resistance transporter